MNWADFYVFMGAVLAANLLTVGFVWAAWNYSRREQLGIENQPGSGVYLGTMIMVFGFLAGSMFIAGFYDRAQPDRRSELQRALDDIAAKNAPVVIDGYTIQRMD